MQIQQKHINNKNYLETDYAFFNKTKNIFKHIEPFKGVARSGRDFNFVGALFPKYLTHNNKDSSEVGLRSTQRPNINNGEEFAEWYSIHKSVESSNKTFKMISLGAHTGIPIVNAYKYIQKFKPTLEHNYIAVEADENMIKIMKENLKENNINLDNISIIESAISHDSKPTFFASSKVPNGMTQVYYNKDAICKFIKDNNISYQQVAESLIKECTTTIPLNMDRGDGLPMDRAEIKIVSSITLSNLIKNKEIIDYLEIDIQGTEYHIIPQNISLINDKVRWIHLGTHCGHDYHNFMKETFNKNKWIIHIDWLPDSNYKTPTGDFKTSDGVLSMQNPRFIKNSH